MFVGLFSVYVTLDIVAVLILIGLCLIPKNPGEKINMGARLFSGMGIFIIAGCAFDILSSLIAEDMMGGGPVLMLILRTLSEAVTMGLLVILLLYTDYELFGSKDHIKRYFGPFLIPIAIYAVLLILNLFTGFIFTIDSDCYVKVTKFYYVLQIVKYIYLILPVYIFTRGYFKIQKKSFLHPFAMYVPILISAITSLITPFSAIYLGFAIGLTYFAFSKIDRWRFIDRNTSFYNRAYLDYIRGMVNLKKMNIKSMIELEVKGDVTAFANVLKAEIPTGSEVISLNEGRFLYVSDISGMMQLKSLFALINDSVEEYNEGHEEKIDFSDNKYHVFKEDKEAIDVMGTFLEGKAS